MTAEIPPDPALRTARPDHVPISAGELADLVGELEGRGARICFRARGQSMWPVIRDGDLVTITPLGDQELRRGDVVAFRHPANGRLLVHRIVALDPDSCITRGDHVRSSDGPIPRASLLGLVSGIERNDNADDMACSAQALAPEHQVLLATMRIDRSLDPCLRALLQQPLDWPAIRNLAVRHGILSTLCQRIDEVETKNVPQNEMDLLHRLHLVNTRRTLQLAQQLVDLLCLLDSAGVEAVPLKGPALALQAYGNLSARQMLDLDVLIRPADFHRTYDILTVAGYRPHYELSAARTEQLLGCSKELLFRGPDHNLDLHWALAAPHDRVPSSDIASTGIWERLSHVSLLGRKIRILCPEDTLLHLCIHGTAHSWSKLMWVADVANLIASSPGSTSSPNSCAGQGDLATGGAHHGGSQLDWQAVGSRAARTGAREAVAIALHLAQEIGGADLPPGARLLLAGTQERAAANNFLAGSLSGTIGSRPIIPAFLRLQWRRPTPAIIRHLLGLIFVPRVSDWQAIHLPDALYPLYYLVRPLRLATRLPRLLALRASRRSD